MKPLKAVVEHEVNGNLRRAVDRDPLDEFVHQLRREGGIRGKELFNNKM